MAKVSLPSFALSDNDVSVLTRVLKHKLDTLPVYDLVPLRYYFDALDILAGLGLSAILLDHHFHLNDYQRELRQFMDSSRCLLAMREKEKQMISESLANMIRWALEAFRAIPFPPHFGVFLDALQGAMGNTVEKDGIELWGKIECWRAVHFELP